MRPEPGRRAHRRLWLWVASGGAVLLVVSAVFAAQPWTAKGDHPLADQLAALGLVVAVLSLGVSTLGLRRPVERDTANLSRGWASNLASQVKKAEGDQRRQLLGADTQRINLTFTLRAAPARAADAPDAGRLFDGTPTVPDVADYYRRTRPRRLVVTGAAGSGKTVLALELMLALIQGRDEDDPVPVRLSLASWDTRVPLPDLLVRRLVEAYDWPAAMATELVRHNRVLPVLDGLDEMDPTLPDGNPDPDAPRALAALRALNAYQDGLDAGPLVLTCRTAHYDALAAHDRLTDAARIEIDAVPAADARTYLSQRAIDRDRWRPVLNALRDDPTGPLATILSTPWRLCLAATVYAHDHDPADLLQHTTPHDLHAHLLARFIPASFTLHPIPYRPADAHRWLARLAKHLEAPSMDPAPPRHASASVDLVLHRLWPMAGPVRMRVVDALFTTLVISLPAVMAAPHIGLLPSLLSCLAIALPVVLAAFIAARSPAHRHPDPTGFSAVPGRLRLRRRALLLVLSLLLAPAYMAFGISPLALSASPPHQYLLTATGVAAPVVAYFTARSRADRPAGLDSSTLRSPASLRRLLWTFSRAILRALAASLCVGLATIAVDLSTTPEISYADSWDTLLFVVRLGLLAGIAAGLIFGVAAAFQVQPTTTRSSRNIIRGELLFGIVLGLVFGLLIVPIAFAAAGGFVAFNLEPTNVRAALRLWALFLGLASALTMASARRYLIFLLCSQGRLPRRLGAFLDHCCTAGIMRLSGPAYQFRHRELQHWLAAHPDPVTHSAAPDGSGYLLAPPPPPFPPTVHLTADS